jgi:hypothetical protein
MDNAEFDIAKINKARKEMMGMKKGITEYGMEEFLEANVKDYSKIVKIEDTDSDTLDLEACRILCKKLQHKIKTDPTARNLTEIISEKNARIRSDDNIVRKYKEIASICNRPF